VDAALGEVTHRRSGERERRRTAQVLKRATRHHGISLRVAAIAALAVLLAGLVVALPTGVNDILADLRMQSPQVYSLTPASVAEQPTRSRLHLAILNVDQWGGTVTIRVSGTHVCDTPCPWQDQFLLVAAQRSQLGIEGLPTFATVTLPPTATEVTQEITLPINGYPLRYPFDTYNLELGVIMQRVPADGVAVPLTNAEAQGHLFISVASHVPALDMNAPIAIDPAGVDIPDSAYEYTNLQLMTFGRPSYQQALAVLLLLLIAVATVYSVFTRSVNELVLGIGSFVITIWGVRSIIVGFTTPGITGVDLALSIIILFLLVAIILRLLHHLVTHVAPQVLRRHSGHHPAVAGDATAGAATTAPAQPPPADLVQSPRGSVDHPAVAVEETHGAAGRQERDRDRRRAGIRQGDRDQVSAGGGARGGVRHRRGADRSNGARVGAARSDRGDDV
jgi:hypothetical protein